MLHVLSRGLREYVSSDPLCILGCEGPIRIFFQCLGKFIFLISDQLVSPSLPNAEIKGVFLGVNILIQEGNIVIVEYCIR